MKCAIKWVDKQGNFTPDTNDAVILVRCRGRIEKHHGRAVPQSEWFGCCAEHAKRLDDAGMHIWECAPLPMNPVAKHQLHAFGNGQ